MIITIIIELDERLEVHHPKPSDAENYDTTSRGFSVKTHSHFHRDSSPLKQQKEFPSAKLGDKSNSGK